MEDWSRASGSVLEAVVDDNAVRNVWERACVVKVHPGLDGEVRVSTVKIAAAGIYIPGKGAKRPVKVRLIRMSQKDSILKNKHYKQNGYKDNQPEALKDISEHIMSPVPQFFWVSPSLFKCEFSARLLLDWRVLDEESVSDHQYVWYRVSTKNQEPTYRYNIKNMVEDGSTNEPIFEEYGAQTSKWNPSTGK
ncbi:unnamed protein product [Allacma fusca]|uniref:DUF5641 domain-containing protein n=1 Tax=Allacma fusca TaxID=39272 RepID=A0A8J2NVM7_9HEXA|nr:unnamed protein product [Allacma fusca]